jgi:DNA-binding CsgD family transcriptional regulator
MHPINLQESLGYLTNYSNQDELVVEILEKFIDIFSCDNAQLYRYSPIGYLAEGVISLENSEVKHIRSSRVDIRSLSVLDSIIKDKRATHYKGIDFMKLMTSDYIFPPEYNSSLIIPLTAGGTVIGFIISYLTKENKVFDMDLLDSLTVYGKITGNILADLDESKEVERLSKRELEVMQHISWGESSKEIAAILGITEATINQYVKSALDKLNAMNRSHAVAELLRKGDIS